MVRAPRRVSRSPSRRQLVTCTSTASKSSSPRMRSGVHCRSVFVPGRIVIVSSATTSCALTVLHHRSIEASPVGTDVEHRNALGAFHRIDIEHELAVVRKAAVGRDGRGKAGRHQDDNRKTAQQVAGPDQQTLTWNFVPAADATGAHQPTAQVSPCARATSTARYLALPRQDAATFFACLAVDPCRHFPPDPAEYRAEGPCYSQGFTNGGNE